GRGFNIDALTVAPTTDPKLSRITLLTHGDEHIIEQITKQLNRLVDVLRVVDLSTQEHIWRELMLIKVKASPKDEPKLQKLIEKFNAQLVDEKDELKILQFVLEVDRSEELLKSLKNFEVLELVRSGHVAMHRGKNTLKA
ncbi:MAG: acetolactate synthase small subunit, partial [Deltaproteobacteria bacterium]|nr:acetolactate synthase small subunit [Deltaproteobacteria bacterium]